MTQELVTVACGNYELIYIDDPHQYQIVTFDKNKDLAIAVTDFPKDSWSEVGVIKTLYAVAATAAEEGNREIQVAADWLRRVLQFRGTDRVDVSIKLGSDPNGEESSSNLDETDE